jgi:hypothetical protein
MRLGGWVACDSGGVDGKGQMMAGRLGINAKNRLLAVFLYREGQSLIPVFVIAFGAIIAAVATGIGRPAFSGLGFVYLNGPFVHG